MSSKRADSSNMREPAAGWSQGLQLQPLRLAGFTVFNGEGAGFVRTRPCYIHLDLGHCPHVGLFLPVCASRRRARKYARYQLARDPRAQELAERRWILPISIEARNLYDLRGVLTQGEALWLYGQLYWGTGDEPAWDFVKQAGVQGMLLPTAVPTLFLFDRFVSSVIELGLPSDPPQQLPRSRLQNALDFVRPNALRSEESPEQP